jgi:hypothetical protein
MAQSIKEKDRGWDHIIDSLEDIPFDVTIGIQGSEASVDHGGITNAMLGSIHEYGTADGRIPQRSFLRSTLNKKEKKYTKEYATALANVAEGKDLEGELKIVGEIAAGDVKKEIKKHIPPILHPSTVARKKGETVPLINTGQLWNSISSLVRKK